MPLPIPNRMADEALHPTRKPNVKPEHVALKKHHVSLPKASITPPAPVPAPLVDKYASASTDTDDLPYDASLDFGDGDALNLNDATYDDPSPSSRRTESHDDDDFQVAHRSEFMETPVEEPITADDGGYGLPDDEDADPDIEQPPADDGPADAPDDEPDDEPEQEDEPQANGDDDADDDGKHPASTDENHGIHAFIGNFIKGVKSEIGGHDANEDDDGDSESTGDHDGDDDHGKDIVPVKPDDDGKKDGNAKNKPSGKSSPVLKAIQYPWRILMSFIRGASKIVRIILSLSGLAFLLIAAWLVFNIIPALANTSTSFVNDEGKASIGNVQYANKQVSFTADNDSDMIAHVSYSATVKAWKPSVSNMKSIIMPIPVMSCSTVMGGDIMPGKSENITLQCNGDEGIWMRPIVKATTE